MDRDRLRFRGRRGRGQGYQDNTATQLREAMDRYANGAWTPQVPPEPSDAGDNTNSNQFAQLVQVVCPSTTACVAVGEYQTSTSNDRGLIESYNGSAWTAQRAPAPARRPLRLLNTALRVPCAVQA